MSLSKDAFLQSFKIPLLRQTVKADQVKNAKIKSLKDILKIFLKSKRMRERAQWEPKGDGRVRKHHAESIPPRMPPMGFPPSSSKKRIHTPVGKHGTIFR